jgi:hypothetical protein
MMIAKRGIRVMIKGAAIVNGCYLMILWLVFSIDMAVLIILGAILLILVDTSTATTTTLNIATNATAWTTIIVVLLIKRYPSILIIRNCDFDWADIVDQHIIGLTQRLGVLINIADIVILYVGNEIAILFRTSMQKQMHGNVFLDHCINVAHEGVKKLCISHPRSLMKCMKFSLSFNKGLHLVLASCSSIY